mmetsp:Transcript_2415/g.4527  ORF Transcript_2415/g.4527 Transcript_2415/m.4527 type:complete len:278 (-) Transcript_2415:235-1068(-)
MSMLLLLPNQPTLERRDRKHAAGHGEAEAIPASSWVASDLPHRLTQPPMSAAEGQLTASVELLPLGPAVVRVKPLGGPKCLEMDSPERSAYALDRPSVAVAGHGSTPATEALEDSSECVSTPQPEPRWVLLGGRDANGRTALLMSKSSSGKGANDDFSNAETLVIEGGHAVPHPPLPSHGAALHKLGTCKACYFFTTSAGCQWGAQCGFCHFDHPARLRLRPGKKKRVRVQRRLDALLAEGKDLQDLLAGSVVQGMGTYESLYFDGIVSTKLRPSQL